MRTEFIDEADAPLAVAKTDKPLAEQLDTHWRAVGLGQLAYEKCRNPISPQHLAHRGSRPGSRHQLVVFACQHRWAPPLKRSAEAIGAAIAVRRTRYSRKGMIGRSIAHRKCE